MANPWSAIRSLNGPRILFLLAALGCAAGVVGAMVSSRKEPPQPPVFDPAPNPYADGIYANGIIESDLAHGSNINVYPEVSGTVARVFVHAGQAVHRGDPLLQIDDRVQRATAGQFAAQAVAARAHLEELRAEPRPEALQVAQAQLAAAEALAQQARDTYDKLQHAADLDAHAVSRDALDTGRSAWRVAEANRVTAARNLDLTRAGAWEYEIRNQDATVQSLQSAAQAALVLQSKFLLQAPADGTVLTVNAGAGGYVAPQGTYDTYTQASNQPLLVLGGTQQTYDVRCYVDEILIPRLDTGARLRAQMFIRGTRTAVPLEFVRVEPYVTPKISLSDQRQERVDVRVLPVIFRFKATDAQHVYPGQMVDVYLGHS